MGKKERLLLPVDVEWRKIDEQLICHRCNSHTYPINPYISNLKEWQEDVNVSAFLAKHDHKASLI